MTTKQAGKSSGIGRQLDRDLGAVESLPGRRVFGLYCAGRPIGAPLDAGVR